MRGNCQGTESLLPKCNLSVSNERGNKSYVMATRHTGNPTRTPNGIPTTSYAGGVSPWSGTLPLSPYCPTAAMCVEIPGPAGRLVPTRGFVVPVLVDGKTWARTHHRRPMGYHPLAGAKRSTKEDGERAENLRVAGRSAVVFRPIVLEKLKGGKSTV